MSSIAHEHAGRAATPWTADARRVEPRAPEPPLVVDLDGTLVRTDLLLESVLALIKDAPLAALRVPFWWSRGCAAVKREIASRVRLDFDLLPYRQRLCEQLREQARAGRRVVLATASDELIAAGVARHLGFFSDVIASDGRVNLKGIAKRDRLVREFGERSFDYIGDSPADRAVWAAARHAIVVDAGPQGALADPPARGFAAFRALRPQHWLKNLLALVPLLAAQRLGDALAVERSLAAFAAFCCLASAFYVLNDVLDLAADRRHPYKRARPIASGDLPPGRALALVPLLLAATAALAFALPRGFAVAAVTYGFATAAYSLRLKRIPLLDVMILAGLYVLRIEAGAAAAGVSVSRWLLGFSMFASLSLALVKRYTEVVANGAAAGSGADGRGYKASDATLLTIMGVVSGFLAALVIALYADSASAARLYAHSDRLWFVCPLFAYWIGHLWLLAERQHMSFDPVVFAVTNRTSVVLILIMIGVTVSAL